MTAALAVREDADDVLNGMFAAWRADIESVPIPPPPVIYLIAEPRADHMPTVQSLRVVEPRFPRLAAAGRWATTVGATGAAIGCIAVAAVLTVAMRAGVSW